jgi:DDE superfamily endonuclease
MVSGFPTRFDYEYTRHGACNLFIMLEPFQGWRHLTVTAQRTKREFAQCMAELVNVHFPKAERIRVVLDKLRTHTPGALYDFFPQPRPAASSGNSSFILPLGMAVG